MGEALASAEDSNMVTLVSSDITIEVTAEALTGSEYIRTVGTGVAKEWVVVGCGGNIPVDKDIAVLSVGIVAKLVSNILMVEAARGSGNVFVLPVVGYEVELPSSGVSEVHSAVYVWVELKISVVPL